MLLNIAQYSKLCSKFKNNVPKSIANRVVQYMPCQRNKKM